MPADEYKTASSGSLKLKGVNPSSKVSKHKKKRQKALENASSDTHANDTDKLKSTDDGAPATSKNGRAQRESDEKTLVEEQSVDGVDEDEDATSSQKMGKTEAELRHEERRRRRLDERLKREGTKTHKERVEELNRYLSNLSEHHDMPRIGPG